MEETVKGKSLDSLKNGYINPGKKEGYPVGENQIHYMIAEQICAEEGWNSWSENYRSAEDYLLHERAFIKVADYFGVCDENFKFVAISENFPEEFQVYVDHIQKMLGVEVSVIEDPKKNNKYSSSFLNR